ncbi:hypothetical protein [Aureispira anguillae]|uniref:Gingipain domain-containing protein n=1 Tax=Aureispira anguillae TaxID=2864201 RepID=A0A915YAY8_9BACT|nr:hypothetical protein [Aureispira anguillae]BDS09675.1 hypothetical protein AsAng_0003790 [Aureispira anguillae]
MQSIYYYFLFLLLISCSPSTPSPSIANQTIKDSTINSPPIIDSSTAAIDTIQTAEEPEYNFDQPISAAAYQPKDDDFPNFDRSNIEAHLKRKVAAGKPLVVHVFVPLCDNEHQGIVRTTASLGNGFSLRSNLYWATRTGMKRYFKEKTAWKLLKSIKNVYKDSVVLERVIFKRTYPNQASVYLVVDAYRGDKMLETVNDFLRAMSSNYTEKVSLEDSFSIAIHGAADLVVFNGHNGLLDLYYKQPEQWYNNSNQQKDMVVIACYANEYFEREAMRAKAYPIVRAKGRLHPGAFVISAIIDDWAMLKSVEDMRLSAGVAYCEVHDCSIKTSKRLFFKGWRSENLTAPY